MAANDATFVEWKEEFVSQERGSRIVHYILKDSSGKSILAVIGTERSLRHMVYVVAEEFLSYSGTDNSIQAGFKWRSRREVVDWLTSMLVKQQQSESPIADGGESLVSSGLSGQVSSLADKMDHRVRNLKQSYSDVVWLGAPWTCGKQLKHYPAFCRNGTTIAVQSFVFVMAKEENSYVAYLEDMYEDRKGQKKVKVRWFHHSQEVRGAVRVRNIHPKEVYITPYTQVISVECVDGPAIVLTREHFEKCVGSFPDSLLGKVHLCFRLFKSNKIKPFDLSKLRGYFDQPVISCLESNTFPNSDSVYCGVTGAGVNAFWSGENVGKGIKRKRNSADQESFLTDHLGAKGNGRRNIICATKNGNSDTYDRRLLSKDLECQRWHTQLFKVNDEIELLCQDSGIRGCWFRCTILEISRKQMKVQYCDIEDQDGGGNLEEWVPAFRLVAADKLGMRCLGRPTIRPCPPISDSLDSEFIVGAAVDARWSDGWWEGVVATTKDDEASNLQVYIPGESLFLNVSRKDVRVSRDWVGGKWVDVKPKPDILSVISQETEQPEASIPLKDDKQPGALTPVKDDNQLEALTTVDDDNQPEALTPMKDDKVDNFTPETKVTENENEEAALPAPAPSNSHHEQVSSPEKDVREDGYHVDCDDGDAHSKQQDDQNVGNGQNDDQSEDQSGVKDTKMDGRKDEDAEIENVNGSDGAITVQS